MGSKNYKEVDIAQALENAFVNCRLNGELRNNTKAYSFVDIVCVNYASNGKTEEDFLKWSKKFLVAGQEAKTLLNEPESVHRKFVPTSFNNAFLRRSVVYGNDGWMTCDQCEQNYWYRFRGFGQVK